jgi:hypothetical protein
MQCMTDDLSPTFTPSKGEPCDRQAFSQAIHDGAPNHLARLVHL